MDEKAERRDNASLAAGNAAPAPQAAAPDSTSAGRARLGAKLESVAPSPPRIEIVSPDASIRWRIGPAGVAEYSEDAGAKWETTPTGVGTDLTAGASPSGDVCFVGRAGAVRRKPTQAVAAHGFRCSGPRRVQATDERTATVTQWAAGAYNERGKDVEVIPLAL